MGLAKLRWPFFSQVHPETRGTVRANRSDLGTPSLVPSVGPAEEGVGCGGHSRNRRQGTQPRVPYFNSRTGQSEESYGEPKQKMPDSRTDPDGEAEGWGGSREE